MLRFPTQVLIYLSPVDGISTIVAWTVGDKLDFFIRIHTKNFDDFLGDFQIVDISRHTPDTVGTAWGGIGKNHVDSTTVIKDVKPVSDVLAITIDFYFFASEEISNHARHEFFRVLVRAKVIAAVGDGDRNIEGVKICSNNVIRGSLGSSVWAMRVVRSFFIELGVTV